MSRSSYFELDNLGFSPPTSRRLTTEASSTQSGTVESTNIQTLITTVSNFLEQISLNTQTLIETVSNSLRQISLNTQALITTDSNSPEQLPQGPSIPEFPLYDSLPREIKWEILYQAAMQRKPRIIPVHIETRLISPNTSRPSDQIDAFVQAGGKWKIREGELTYLTITRGYGWHAREYLILVKFYFRPEKRYSVVL
ncbi:hypothetical protein EAE96_003382 [Botrytis aclada]|nr:hypothetical protein EAE96_003382 [Botrytis aclada]